MRIEIGGGVRPRGEGFLNVDLLDCADIKCDLNETPWPIETDSADEVYSSHCIEHVRCPHAFLREVARIGKLGAKVEIRCPDSISEMAMVTGHVGVCSINFMRHADHVFPDVTWSGSAKKLKMLRIEPGADDYWFPMARKNPLFAMWKDDDILTWIPRTRHENRFYFEVVAN
ncbi:MAG TPA: methyltransferase domain-containing protein [Planctomycetaceae bacterium]|nr:methyltransferase domain-containing protein [Planctomycetaceae bacterium]